MTSAPAVKHRPALGLPAAPRPRRRIAPIINLAGSLLVSAAVLYAAFFPAGPLPALGPSFNPATGAWTMAADAQVTDRTLALPGLQQPVRVLFEANGVAHISAQTDHDLLLATGYVHARFRLFQMDLMRRQGEGRLSEVFGKAALDTDKFFLQLGLLRTAQLEWSQLPDSDEAHQALVAYAQGVNDRIAEAESTNQLDALFTLIGYKPRPWTPIDSLVIKGVETEVLNFSDTPLLLAQLNKSLGPDLTSEWFPILPPNMQSPYDPGPYTKAAPAPIETMRAVSDAEAATAASIYQRLASLPQSLITRVGASNNWAVAPSKSTSGGALLAGDPHLDLTLPSIWFQLTQDSPSYHLSGASIPGTTGVTIGHNQHIAWSLTDAMNQQTFFYEEKEDATHTRYFWNGAWQPYKTVAYDIPVLGEAPQHLVVKLSIHGPVVSDRGITTSVWWAGNLPSQDIRALMNVARASSWQEFRDALRDWHSPTHNFVYADDRGHIGLISAGYFPQVPKGQPWLPLPGTGEYDVAGTIPYDDIPQVYDPPSGIVWSANQWQVTPAYPYYLGTASNFYDPGYRANEIHRVLSQAGKLGAADMIALQTDTRDFLASEIVPVLLQSLSSAQLSPLEAAARDLLTRWDYRMETNSAAASLWSTFWDAYVSETFDPWWKSRSVKVKRADVNDMLGQDLEAWTLNDPSNRAFSAPGVGDRTAPDAQLAAFQKAVKTLRTKLGGEPRTWSWGRIHTRELVNLALIGGLDYGPRPERGDANTPLAAHGANSTSGPSWRMVVDWGSRTFQGVYPGGQSENPASAWYTNRVETWWNGNLDPMLAADEASGPSGAKTWSLHP